MGRGIRHSRRKKQNKDKPKKDRDTNPGVGYKDIVKENVLFQTFYEAQKDLCPPDEYQAMLECLRRDLPASFRVTGFRSQAIALRNFIESQYFRELTELADLQDKDGDNPTLAIRPKCLEWYPEKMAWQLNLTRKDIRRQEIYFKLHNFLISETESGNISRQETVSMIPPLVLDVKPEHKVLDMCAAPGSKTAQLIEAIHAQEGVIPAGFVIANDSDNARCYMLVHQAKRLQSPCVIITNHDASNMPNIFVTDKVSGDKNVLKFDRILCDVPCTGDGTLRKNADIWPKWNASNAANLHGIQYRIARRGIELLEVGGRMVYSTCSLNPMEDEAVLARLLEETGDSVELVEVSDMVPGLKYRKGIGSWVVSNKDGDLYNDWSEVPEKFQSQLRPSMFPPQNPGRFNLDRCIRILPHMQDTGGFFVAVLKKKSLCPWESQPKSRPADPEKSTVTGDSKSGREPPRKRPRFQGYREDPFIYFEDDDPSFIEIQKFFNLQGLDSKMFLTRCKDESKRNNLYFTSLQVRNIVKSNVERIKIINTGVKAFSKCENKGATCTFRLAQEGALMTLPFLGSRSIKASRKDLEVLLSFSDFENPPAINLLDKETQDQFGSIGTGSVGVIYDDGQLKLGIVGWKGKSTVRAYVPKNERLHHLRLIGGDTSKFETNKFQQQREAEKKDEANGQNGESVNGEAAKPEEKKCDAKTENVENSKIEEAQTKEVEVKNENEEKLDKSEANDVLAKDEEAVEK